jgi:hypothetical protein
MEICVDASNAGLEERHSPSTPHISVDLFHRVSIQLQLKINNNKAQAVICFCLWEYGRTNGK